MHIPDGILPAKVCIAGYALTGLATWFSLRQINRSQDPNRGIPKAAMLTAAFFIASLIRIPIPPASLHLVLNGLLGAVLGYYAFPAILVGLFFQAIMFGHGGLSTLGVNAAMMGIPALVASLIFQFRHQFIHRFSPKAVTGFFAFWAGAIGLGIAVLIFWGLIVTFIPSGFDALTERAATATLVLSHVPLMAIEGTFTTLLVLFLTQVKPELLQNEW
jgi:cobalt/nickel transport system permease protein